MKLPKSRRAVLRMLCGTSMWYAAARMRPASARAAKIRPGAGSVLIVVDVQNCFMTGALAVPNGGEVVPVINKIAPAFENVVLTQDWHPRGHASFASSHPGMSAFQIIKLSYGNQMLWPDHCVQGTADAELVSDLNIPQAQLIVRKGFHREVDSYSAFKEVNGVTATGLRGYLKERGIESVFVSGLATDFCVAWTAIDARKADFETYVIEDACRGIDLHDSMAAAWKAMSERGVQRIQSSDIDLG